MAAAIPLELAYKLFPLAQGNNPWQMPPTHIDQIPADEISAAMRESKRQLDLLLNLTGEQARQNCLPR